MDRKTLDSKLNEVKRLAKEKQYMMALKVLETVNIDKIRNMMDLSVIANVLMYTDQYDDAMETLLRIYEKTCTRRVLEQLITLCLRMKNFGEVNEYYKEYIRIAPKDPNRLVLRYRIEKESHASYKQRIETLEELKKEDYIEEWGYELAKLYHKTGQAKKCVEECSDLILWFGKGIIVEKAKLLKEHYTSGIDIANTLSKKEFDATVNLADVIKQVKDKTDSKTLSPNEVDKTVSDSKQFVSDELYLASVRAVEKDKEDAYVLTKDIVREVNEQLSDKKEDWQPEKDVKVIKEEVNMYSVEEEEVVDTGKELYVHGFDMQAIFGHFIRNSSIREQIISIVKNIEKDPKCNNFLVCGDRQSGKTSLAKAIAITMWKLNKIQTKKIAKINAAVLNKLVLEDKWNQLEGGAVLIEQAGELSSETVDSLIKMILHFNGAILVILEDSTRSLQNIPNSSKLQKYFKHRIVIPKYEEEDYYAFTLSLLEKQKYQLENDVCDVLKEKITKLIRNTKPQDALLEIKKYIEAVIKNVELRNSKKLLEQAKNGTFGSKIEKVVIVNDL